MVEPLRHRQTKGAATDMFYLMPPRHISTLPFATGSSRQQVRPCPLCPESRSDYLALGVGPLPVDGAAVDVIQALKLEPRIRRYELSGYEWIASSRCCLSSRAAFSV